jgi:phosphoserine phosphatase RsbU/P
VEGSRKRISIITKIFSVFLALTALDLSLIYVFTATGQIDQIGRNGLLVAENAALRIAQTLSGFRDAKVLNDDEVLKHLATVGSAGTATFSGCYTIGQDGKAVSQPGLGTVPRAVKALKLYESEKRLFYVDLALGSFTADVFVPYRPAADAVLRVVGCHVPLQSIRDSFDRLLRLSLMILGLTLLFQAAIGWFIYVIFIKRLRSLEKATVLIGQGDFTHHWETGKRFDEIDHLGQTLNEMRVALAEKTRILEDTLMNLEKANFHLEGDLILGEEIQQSILPEKTAGKNIKWLVTFRPMSRVSGDFYDVYDLPGGATGILQFDASGHGVPAALLTMMAKISFVDAIQRLRLPNQVVGSVNAELSGHLQKTGNFLTAFYAVVRPDGHIQYCNAAHTQVQVLRRNGEVELYDPNSLSIGFAPGMESFHVAELVLHAGDRLVVHTDGLTETMTRSGEPYGAEGLTSVLKKNAGADLATLHAAIYSDWQSLVEKSAIEDDLTIITLEI